MNGGHQPGRESDLLEQSLEYLLGTLDAVGPELLNQPTPCRFWTLEQLLLHVTESLDALAEGARLGAVDPVFNPGTAGPEIDSIAAAGAAARRLRELRARLAAGRPSIQVGDRCLPSGLLALIGALEIAAHGWDIAQAGRLQRPIPAPLAEELLPIAAILITDADRRRLFGSRVSPPAGSTPGDRLVAFLGRRPR